MPALLLALLLAFCVDLLFAELPNKLHPVLLMRHFIRSLSQKWNHGSPKRRFWLGFLLTFLGMIVFALPFVPLLVFGSRLPWWLLGVLSGLLLKPTFALRALIKAGMEVYGALKEGNLDKARRLVAWHLVSRDTSQLSEGQVSSAVIESLSENLTDSFVTPLLCFALGGLPLAWAYRFVNTADAMIGYRNENYEYFGKTAAILDDVFNWLPARLAGLTLVVASFLCGADGSNAWRTMLKDHAATSSPNSGWTMAALAGAIGKKMEKPGAYVLSEGSELPNANDIKRANRIILVSGVINWLLTGGLIVELANLF